MNYRLNDIDPDTAKQLIEAGNLELLLALDQLREQMHLHKTFRGFSEAEIKFKPTFKYDPGTDNWDSR